MDVLFADTTNETLCTAAPSPIRVGIYFCDCRDSVSVASEGNDGCYFVASSAWLTDAVYPNLFIPNENGGLFDGGVRCKHKGVLEVM